MKKNIFRIKDYAAELVELIRRTGDRQRLPELLSDYHGKDIAEAVTRLSADERRELYRLLGTQRVSEIFSYLDDAEPYINELPVELAAKVVSGMDADDAVDVLDDLSGDKKQALVERLDSGAQTDVQRILAYGEDEIGSCMTNNYICISEALTIRGAMSELVQQAGEHDNISTLYVVDAQGRFAGAIDLKDLIIAREGDRLEDIISRSYPYVFEHDRIDDCIERIRDYDEDSLPVLTQDGHIAGILTSSDIVELVDDAMGDDYAKLAGLTSEDDLKEPVTVSMKKRLPWLIALLFLGMAVSSVVGMFESVAAALPIVICFQSLAVTIRVLMDEDLTARKKLSLLAKEMKIGFLNGTSLGVMALVFLGVYVHVFKGYAWLSAFLISGCVGVSLVAAMVISSLVGTVIPMFFHRIHIDPAVASGPLITTVNDLVAVVTYYGLAAVFLINIFNI